MRLALAFTLMAGPALAQPACAPHAVVIEQLADGWGEGRVSIGLSRGALVEMFANRETGTWTITVTGAGGLTCIVAAGEAFETVAPEPAGIEG